MQGESEVQLLPKMLFNLNSCVNVASGNTTRCGTQFGWHFGLNNWWHRKCNRLWHKQSGRERECGPLLSCLSGGRMKWFKYSKQHSNTHFCGMQNYLCNNFVLHNKHTGLTHTYKHSHSHTHTLSWSTCGTYLLPARVGWALKSSADSKSTFACDCKATVQYSKYPTAGPLIMAWEL